MLANERLAVWRAAGAFVWREIDGQFLVFSPADGGTHALDALTAALLQHLEVEPASVDSLASWLAARSEGCETALVEQSVCRILDNLDEAGLVESVNW